MTLVTAFRAGKPEFYPLQVAGNPQSSATIGAVVDGVDAGYVAAASFAGTTVFGHYLSDLNTRY